MIISHKHKFIFFAVAKTASHAIRRALRPYLGNQDEEHVHHFKPSRLVLADFQHRKNGHFTVSEIKPHLNDELWNSYFKFSFVRNPWDRFISLCFFYYPAMPQNPDIAKALMKKIAKQPLLEQHNIFTPQSNFLFESGSLAMDFVGKFENLNKDFNTICDKLGIGQSELKSINKSAHEPYFEYYDEEFKSMISDLYKPDIINFNYTFE